VARRRLESVTLITTPFSFESTAAEVVAGIDLTGKRAIVTGGASGIGIETARALKGAGADVTLAVRDTAAGERVAADLGGAHVRHLDLAAFTGFAWDGPLDILVNNAGVMALPTLQRTPQGIELQFATNHLGHFALAAALHEHLKAAPNARIVSLSSVGHLRSPVHFEDINYEHRPYDAADAYGQSKTANALFAVEATRRWSADGITANAVHPGAIFETNLSRHLDPAYIEELRTAGVYRPKTPQQGAATSVLVATSPLLEGIGGRYFEDANEAGPHTGDEYRGVAPYALDPEAAERLWELSLELTAPARA